MKNKNIYRYRVIGILLLGIIIWVFLGFLSQIGIFSYGIDFGFDLIKRRLLALLGLSFLVALIFLSIIATLAYRKHFPKLDKEIMIVINGYKKLKSIKKFFLWILIFGILLNIIIFLLPLYIFILTDQLSYDFEFYFTISSVIMILGLIVAFIPNKNESDQEKMKEGIK